MTLTHCIQNVTEECVVTYLLARI